MLIAVIDGQGGGIGKSLVERLRKALGQDVRILALGTNPLATSQMLKAGATMGASGENPIIVNAKKANIIVGSIGIIAADAMLGEVTPAIAHAVSASDALKVLIPLNRCGLIVAGTGGRALPDHIDDAVQTIVSMVSGNGKSDCDCL